jgi:hypothetical protein
MMGIVDALPGDWGEPVDETNGWASAQGDLGGLQAVLLDPERLVNLLRRFRTET